MTEVSALRRPPVRQSVLVRSPRAHTFETFVTAMGTWWPVNPFSAGKDRVRDVTVERRVGGRVYETWADGTQVDWGELLAEDCALPGGYRGGAFGKGWAFILGRLAEAAEARL
jgi:hypothetical protein